LILDVKYMDGYYAVTLLMQNRRRCRRLGQDVEVISASR
jgi:hypothetical protein